MRSPSGRISRWFPAWIAAAALAAAQAQAQAQETVLYLPFAAGTRVTMNRGNDTPPTHVDVWNKYAFDFMPLSVGTPLHAVASGTIVVVKEDSTGPTGRWQDNNQVAIRLADGRVALYEHLMKDGAVVEVGQEVLAGDLVGYSGNTGNSEGPHLHFVMRSWEDTGLGHAIPGRFADVDGDGIPKNGQPVLSANVSIRALVGELSDFGALWPLVAKLDAREALDEPLGRLAGPEPSAGARAFIAATKGRTDLARIWTAHRDRTLAPVDADAAAKLQGAREALESGDPALAFERAYLGKRDFAGTAQAKAFDEQLRAIRKEQPDAARRERELAPELKFRAALEEAVQAEWKARQERGKGGKARSDDLRRKYQRAAQATEDGERRAVISAHLETLEGVAGKR